MIKVAHVITRLDMGGSAQNTMDTCLRLDPEKFEVLLIHGLSRESRMTPDEAQAVEEKKQTGRRRGVVFQCLPALVRRINPILDFRALLALVRLLRRFQPTIVHTHTSKAGLLGRIAAWTARVPVIVQTPHGHVFYGHFGPVVSRLFLFLERLAARITDCIVALTERERSEYRKLGLIGNERLAVIHSGVLVDRYRVNGSGRQKTRKALGIDADACVVGSVGWLLPIKGPHYLLEAVAPLLRVNGKIQLLYVGKGAMEAVLKGIVEQRGLEKSVRFLGWRNNVPDLLSVFDIFVLPSLNEGMGRVLIEAMAAGLPIVASRTGGIPDLIIHGENGLLVPPADPRRLGAAIEFLVRHPEERRRIGGSGRMACAKYSTPAMVAKIESLYRRLLHCKQIPCC